MKIIATMVVFFVYCSSINANEKIAILDFELNDITSLPNTGLELKRTASIKPLLEQELKKKGGFDIIQISLEKQKQANPGLGYLFRFHDITASIGKQYGADWVLVGQHSKPSFLYSYFIAYLVNVEMGKAVVRYDIELKGNNQKVTERAVKRLERKVNNTLGVYYETK